MPHEAGGVAGDAEDREARHRLGVGDAAGFRHQRPSLLRPDIGHVRLHERSQMQLRGVFDEERIRHESEHRIGAVEFRETACLGRIVDGRKTSRRPTGSSRGGLRKLIHERLCVAGSAGISGSAENQGRKRCC